MARAVDDEGQIVEQRAELTIRNGGKPLAEIVPQSVGVDVAFAVQPWDARYLNSVCRQWRTHRHSGQRAGQPPHRDDAAGW